MTAAAAYQALGLRGRPTPGGIKRAFRARIVVAHPDHGGATAAARALIEAREVALAELERRPAPVRAAATQPPEQVERVSRQVELQRRYRAEGLCGCGREPRRNRSSCHVCATRGQLGRQVRNPWAPRCSCNECNGVRVKAAAKTRRGPIAVGGAR